MPKVVREKTEYKKTVDRIESVISHQSSVNPKARVPKVENQKTHFGKKSTHRNKTVSRRARKGAEK